jgi:hypothetical protein
MAMASNQAGEKRLFKLDRTRLDTANLNAPNLTNMASANDAQHAEMAEPDPANPGIIDPGIPKPLEKGPEQDIDPKVDPEIPDPDKHDRDIIEPDAGIK